MATTSAVPAAPGPTSPARSAKYADSADGEWTAKVTNKALYDAAGSDAYDNYQWTVYRNGVEVKADKVTTSGNKTTNDNAGRDYAFGEKAKTSSERVLTSGEGVLTQVFVDSDAETAVVTLIDTGVAKVTKVTEDTAKGNYEVTVNFKTKVVGVNSPETKFTTDTKFAKDDVVVYTASSQSGEIETMAKAKTVAGKVSAQKDGDYTSIDGTSYTYNYAYTGNDGDSNYIGTGLYNLEDSKRNDHPTIDKDATLYLDAYGYAVAFEGKTSTAEDYLFVKGVDVAFSDDISAKVVFYDGTKKTIDIDQFDNKDAKDENGRKPVKYGVYKYTAGSSDYDLDIVDDDKVVDNNANSSTLLNNVKISNKTPSIVAVTTDNSGKTVEKTIATADSQTVFVDVENNKTWTGYKNVSNKSKANVKVVLNKDNVAEIVFLYGDDMSSSANDDDFVILKGTGLESVKDANKKTVYRFTDAYDVNGEKINDLYAADPDVLKDDNGAKMGKGLFLIKNYNSDDYVTKMVRCYSIDDLAMPASALTPMPRLPRTAC